MGIILYERPGKVHARGPERFMLAARDHPKERVTGMSTMRYNSVHGEKSNPGGNLMFYTA